MIKRKQKQPLSQINQGLIHLCSFKYTVSTMIFASNKITLFSGNLERIIPESESFRDYSLEAF